MHWPHLVGIHLCQRIDGLSKWVDEWLRDAFPSPFTFQFVCVCVCMCGFEFGCECECEDVEFAMAKKWGHRISQICSAGAKDKRPIVRVHFSYLLTLKRLSYFLLYSLPYTHFNLSLSLSLSFFSLSFALSIFYFNLGLYLVSGITSWRQMVGVSFIQLPLPWTLNLLFLPTVIQSLRPGNLISCLPWYNYRRLKAVTTTDTQRHFGQGPQGKNGSQSWKKNTKDLWPDEFTFALSLSLSLAYSLFSCHWCPLLLFNLPSWWWPWWWHK